MLEYLFFLYYNIVMKEKSTCLCAALPFKSGNLYEFFYGAAYPLIVAAFAVLSYFTAIPQIAIIAFGIFACVSLIIFRDLTPIVTPLAFVMLIFRSYDAVLTPVPLIVFGAVFCCIIAHFIIYPMHFVKGKLYLPLIFVSVAILIGGVGSPYIKDYMRGFATAVAVGPVLLLVYFIFTSYVCPPKPVDKKMSVCYLLTVLGVAVSLEIVLHRYFCSFPDLIANHDDLGWNNVNGVGALLIFTIPACWYVITRNKHVVLSLLSIVIIYTGVFLTKSDGCIGTALVFIPVLALFSVFRGDNLHKNVLAKIFLVVLLIMVAIAGFALTKTSIKSVWDFLILKLSNDTNRTLLYKEALELFKAFPILGVGQGYYNPDGWLITSAVVAYNFHSTFFHVLATMGIVGVIVYIYYFVQRYRILMHNNSAFNLFMFFAFTMYEIYAMVDTGEFNVMPALLVVTLTLIFVERINEKGNDGALPLQLK